MTKQVGVLCSLILAGMALSARAQARPEAQESHPAVPYPTKATPQAIDRGRLSAQPGVKPISFTVALSIRNRSEAESLVHDMHTPGNPHYHQFLSSEQFSARFAPTPAEVARVIAALAKHGLTATRTTATTLAVSGMPADVENAFGVNLHSYEVAAHGGSSGYTYHAPLNSISISSEMAGLISGIAGLDSRPSFHPMKVAAPQGIVRKQQTAPSATVNPPGFLTVSDFVSQYDVQPLYKQGLTGKGRTMGIVTLASFTPSDAFLYWSLLGINVNPNRLQVINVDGGPGAPSDDSGSDETTLDVEQSGGIAPGANIIVYAAPNSGQGFLDGFAAAIESNSAQSVSVSWGGWEWFYNLDNDPVTDPFTGKTVSFQQAATELFIRAALQGQTLFAASGDGGAYDVNRGCLPPYCTLALSVDFPSSDPFMTSAGGTTLPGLQEYCENSACTPPFFDINIPRERVWGWDYLTGLCALFGADPISCGIFPGGGGGGVSVFFPRPLYQLFQSGVQNSQPGQSLSFEGTLLFNLPAHYPGRNTPDVSFNADPETGYIIIYTSDHVGLEELTFIGGTSFVAPQLNGVTALLGQSVHSRIGMINYPLYTLSVTGLGYHGPHPAFNAIIDGDNWFYQGRNGYSPAAGVGTLDVANFAKALQVIF